MQVKLFLIGLSFFSLTLAQSADNQQKAVAWLETLEQESQQYLESYFSNLQTLDLTTTFEMFDEQGDPSEREMTEMSVDLEKERLYLATIELEDGESEEYITVITPETGCSDFEGEIDTLSEEERQPYRQLLNDPLQTLDELVPFHTSMTDIQYKGNFSVPGLIEGERVDFTYGELPLSYIFDTDGNVVGKLDSDDSQETLTVYRNEDEGPLFGQSALNYDEYLLGGDEPQLIERVRTTEYAINEALDESLFQCPDEAQ